MPRLINPEIMANPLNWAIVLTMLLFGLFLVALISPQE